jgi:hypothetical protein
MKKLTIVAVLLAASCGVPSTPGNGTCAAHLSGSVNADLGCYVNTLAGTQDGNGVVEIEFSEAGLASRISIATRGVPAAGVFASSDPAAKGVCEVVSSDDDRRGILIARADTTDGVRGSYKLALTSVTPRALFPDGRLANPWLDVHGSLDCQMGNLGGELGIETDVGTATLHVTF